MNEAWNHHVFNNPQFYEGCITHQSVVFFMFRSRLPGASTIEDLELCANKTAARLLVPLLPMIQKVQRLSNLVASPWDALLRVFLKTTENDEVHGILADLSMEQPGLGKSRLFQCKLMSLPWMKVTLLWKKTVISASNMEEINEHHGRYMWGQPRNVPRKCCECWRILTNEGGDMWRLNIAK